MYSIIRIDLLSLSMKFIKLIICFCECISNFLSVFISDSIYVYDILRYYNFQISFSISFRLSRYKLLDSKQLVCIRVINLIDYFKLTRADLIM